MKVILRFFKCMESMARDMRHPYIPSTTVLGDITLHVCQASLAGTRHNMCVYIPSTIQYMCRGSLLDGRDSCVASFITQHTLFCRSKLAPPLTNSTTTSVLPHQAAIMRAVSPSCAVTDN